MEIPEYNQQKQATTQGEPSLTYNSYNPNSVQFWARFKSLTSDSNLQIVAMERLQALLQEILQCERNYETQLRRVGSIRKDICKNIQEGTALQGQQNKKDPNSQSITITGQNQNDNHSNIYNLAVQSLQNYCLNKADLIKRDSKFLKDKIFNQLSEAVKDQQIATQQLSDQGNNLVKQMKNLQKKMYAFNQKYLNAVANKKKDDGIFKFLKRKIKKDNPQQDKEKEQMEDYQQNLSAEQKEFQTMLNNQNVMKLLDEQVDLGSKMQKKFRQEVEDLRCHSEEFREQYAVQMKSLVEKIETLMQHNIYTCKNTFDNFYNYGNHKCESERKIVHSFKSDFEKMGMIDSFNEYISNEIPKFNPKWLTSFYDSNDIDTRVIDKIHNNLVSWHLAKQDIKVKQNRTIMHLPDIRTDSNARQKMSMKQSMRILGEEKRVLGSDVWDNEYLDKQQLETDFSQGLKKEIDEFLLKAWHGNQELNEDELRRFREIMRYKQGQQLFIHLLNQFRIKGLKEIANQTSMFSLGELLDVVLDENYDCDDTSIPINCHVLASTFYIEVSEVGKPSVKHYLFELIQKNDFWQNLNFWERVISQFIQFDIIKNKEEEIQMKQVEQERLEKMRADHAAMSGQNVQSVASLPQKQQSSDNFQFNEENLQKMTSFVHLKLTQIQHDMMSFDIPKRDIKNLMNKYLKQSKIIPNYLARDIMMKLQIQDQVEADAAKKKLVVSDQIFSNEFQQSVNRDQRSTLFGIAGNTARHFAYNINTHSGGARTMPQPSPMNISISRDNFEEIKEVDPEYQRSFSDKESDDDIHKVENNSSQMLNQTKVVGTSQIFESKHSSPKNVAQKSQKSHNTSEESQHRLQEVQQRVASQLNRQDNLMEFNNEQVVHRQTEVPIKKNVMFYEEEEEEKQFSEDQQSNDNILQRNPMNDVTQMHRLPVDDEFGDSSDQNRTLSLFDEANLPKIENDDDKMKNMLNKQLEDNYLGL